MYVNHEVGSIMPIKQISQLLKSYPKVIFHSDITQALGKTPIDLSLVDVATMSAHKIHGIKGSGFIYKKDKVSFYPIISGLQSYNSLRAGTSNWPSNVVMSIHCKL
jgi:cysteine desulfurase